MPVSFRAASSSASTSTTVTAPAGAQVGDVLIACCCYGSGSTGTAFTWPAGWTVQDVQTGRSFRMEVATAIYNGTDTSWTVGGSQANVCAAYAGASLPLIAHGVGSTSTTTTTTTASVNNTSDSAWRIAIYAGTFLGSSVSWSNFNPADTQRGTKGVGSGTRNSVITLVDSGAAVASGSQSASATSSAAPNGAAGWLAFLNPTALSNNVGRVAVNRPSLY